MTRTKAGSADGRWLLGAALLLGAGLFVWVAGRGSDTGCLEALAATPDGRFVLDTVTEGERVRVRYADGTARTVPLGPRRIVSALPGITEMIAHLDGLERVVAVTPHCDQPPAVSSIPKVTVQPLDVEGILARRPDLIVVDRTLHRNDLAALAERFENVLPLETSRSLPHLEVSLSVLAAVLGTPRAERAAAQWRERAQALVASIRAEAPAAAPRVLALVQWDPLYALGRGALLDDLLRICGCINIACDLPHASGPFSEELVLERRPDWILMRTTELPPTIRERWHRVPAVANDRLACWNADDLVRGGPRLLDGLRRLGAVLRAESPPSTLAGPEVPER